MCFSFFTVLGAILQEQPSDADVAQLLSILDDDKSGVIEFQDFLNTMAKWLEEANAGMTSSQKRMMRIEDVCEFRFQICRT